MELIDTHCHLDVEDFDTDRQQVIDHCYQLGIKKIIVPAIVSKTWPTLLQICKQQPSLYPALGLHPVFINQHTESDLQQLKASLQQYTSIAVGEIGLDYYIENPNKERQLYFFQAQLEIAAEFDLPVILHIRKAHNDVLKLLKKIKVKGGSCHAFSGSYEQGMEYIKLGFKLGFGGTLTYPNARKIHALAKDIPLEHIILETDAPDMSGHKHRGQRNSPEYLPEALMALASLKNISEEEVAKITSENASKIFAI